MRTDVVGRCQAQQLTQDFAVAGDTYAAYDGQTRQAICLDKGGALAREKIWEKLAKG